MGTKLAYGFGSAAFGIKDAGFGIFLLVFYSQVIGLDAARVGFALTLALVLDAFLDPIVGYWSDNFRSRWGRRHPFMYASAIPVATAYFFLWCPPVGWDKDALFWYVLVLAVLTRFFLTFFETPNAALAPELTRDYDERSSLLGWRGFFAWNGANVMTVMMFAVLFPAFKSAAIPDGRFNRDAYVAYAWIAAGLMLASILVSSFGTQRRAAKLPPPPVRRISLGTVFREMFETFANRSFLAIFVTALVANVAVGFGNGLSLYFTAFFWRFTSEQTSIITLAIFISVGVGAWLASVVTRRFGKKKAAILVGTLGTIVSPVAILFRLTGVISTGADSTFWVVFVQGQVEVVLIVCLQVLLASMISDLVEQSEVKTGRRSEGVFFAANTFIQKVTTGVGVTVATLVLTLAHFPEGATPDQVSESTLLSLGWWYLPVIILLRIGMIVTIIPYTLDRTTHVENLRKLGDPPA